MPDIGFNALQIGAENAFSGLLLTWLSGSVAGRGGTGKLSVWRLAAQQQESQHLEHISRRIF